jgi:hypothetical protein
VDSYLHLCRRGYHHVHVDALAIGTVDVNEDPVALYLGVLELKLIAMVVCVGLEDSLYFV